MELGLLTDVRGIPRTVSTQPQVGTLMSPTCRIRDNIRQEIRPRLSTISDHQLLSHKMTIPNAAPTDVFPNQEINEHSNARTPKQLPPEFYEYFLSDAAKEREPSPSESLLIIDR